MDDRVKVTISDGVADVHMPLQNVAGNPGNDRRAFKGLNQARLGDFPANGA